MDRERPPPWNLAELRDYVQRNLRDKQFVLNIISSLDWSDRIFRYHFCLARDALHALRLDPNPNSTANLELLFSSSEEHDHQMLIIRANVIACIHTVRNAYDHLAQLCNSLLLDKPMSVELCDINRVFKLLPDSPLKEQLSKLKESHWFKYVAAYSNTSKHRALIQQGLHLSFEDGVVGVRAESFTHDQAYPAYMVGDLLEGILGVKNHIIACGRALNSQVVPAS